MKLKQKQGSRSREFELVGNKLNVITKSMWERNEFHIDLEEIGEKRHYKTHSRTGNRILGLIFYLIMILAIIAFFMEKDMGTGSNIAGLILGILFGGGIGSLAFFAKMRNELHLLGGPTPLMFLLDEPSKEKMDNFVDVIIRKSRKIIRDKYSKIDPDLPEETQMENLYWLKSRGLISEEEYKNLKQEYKDRRLMR